jgi:hypothetical protein
VNGFLVGLVPDQVYVISNKYRTNILDVKGNFQKRKPGGLGNHQVAEKAGAAMGAAGERGLKTGEFTSSQATGESQSLYPEKRAATGKSGSSGGYQGKVEGAVMS